MDFTKEIWHCELYKLQQQSPNPIVVKCKRKLERRPPQFGDEYHGNIDRNDTERVLLDYCNGAFLIRDSQRNVGAFTLVIRFDKVNKNYVLYYNPETRQHYVGSKYFDNIHDLVQDGLIHMYIESRGANILRQIAEAKNYEATPFYRSRLYTIEKNSHRHNNDLEKQKIADFNNRPVTRKDHRPTNIVDNYNSSCDSGIFSSLRSGEGTLEKGDSNSDPTERKIIGGNSIDQSQQRIPVAPPRCKSLYYSLRDKVIPRPVVTLPDNTSATNAVKSTHYEPIFNCDNMSDQTDGPFKSFSVHPRSDSRQTHTKNVSNRNTVMETSSGSSFSDLKKSHNFKQRTFVGPQWCDFCAHFMWGLVAQGVQCFDCGFQAHKKCSDKVAADCFPVMKRLKRVFGIELTSLAKMDNRAVPIIFERLIQAVEARDLSLLGIYRISGNIDVIEEVKADLDKDIESVDLVSDPRLVDMETLTGLVKLFLRQLPIPLITSDLYLKLIPILKAETNVNLRQAQFKDSLTILNSVHYSTLEFFIRHLKTVTKSSSLNCMTSSNLAIVFAPTLISKPISPDCDLSPEMLISRMQSDFKWDSTIVQELIDGCDSIFCQGTLNET